MNKDKIRKNITRKIEALPCGLKSILDEKILQNVLNLSKFKKAKRIAVFPYHGGVNTNLIIKKCIELGKLIYIISYYGEKDTIFLKIRNLNDLTFRYKRTRVKSRKLFKSIHKLDLVFANCLGFTPQGYIVGFGCGDRDRFYFQNPSFINKKKEVILAYSFQLVKNFPLDKFDVPTTSIITDRGILKIIE